MLQVTSVVEAVSLLIAANKLGPSKVEQELRKLLPAPSLNLYALKEGRDERGHSGEERRLRGVILGR